MTDSELADLYERHGYFLFRRCLAFLASEAAAQDAVQEVFVRAIRAASQFRGEANPRTWLARIADNHCVDVLRHRQRGEAIGDMPRAEPKSDDTDDAAAHGRIAAALGHDDPDAIIDAHRMLRQLDPGERRLAVLYYVDELTQDEVAAEMKLSRRTIGKRLKALGGRVRELLGEEAAS